MVTYEAGAYTLMQLNADCVNGKKPACSCIVHTGKTASFRCGDTNTLAPWLKLQKLLNIISLLERTGGMEDLGDNEICGR